MEQAAPPRRSGPGFGDAVSFFAALLGLALLIATARHLFWSDSVGAGPISSVAPAVVLVARGADLKPATRANRIERHAAVLHAAARNTAARPAVPRQATLRQGAMRIGASNSTSHSVARRAATINVRPPTTQPAVPASGSPGRIARKARSSQPIVRIGSHPIVGRIEPHPRQIAHRAQQRSQAAAPRDHQRIVQLARPVSAGTLAVHNIAHRSQPAAHRIAARSQGRVASPASVQARAKFAQNPPRRAIVAARFASSSAATRRARTRAREAAIIEPPLGYQTLPTLVELPAASSLDFGPDPIATLQIRLKHRH